MQEINLGEKSLSGGKLSKRNWEKEVVPTIQGKGFVLNVEKYGVGILFANWFKDQGEESEGSEEEEDKGEPLINKVLQISLQSKEGLTSNRSFKVVGMVKGKEVIILLDMVLQLISFQRN